MRILGVDPGITGGWALHSRGVLEAAGLLPVVAVKRNRRERPQFDPLEFSRLLHVLTPDFVIIENVHGRKGQGGASQFSFGDTFGCIRAASLIYTGTAARVIPVLPIVWQARTGVRRESVQGGCDTKEAARRVASRLFPVQLSGFNKAGDKGGFDDGVFDAVLIADYGARFQPWA